MASSRDIKLTRYPIYLCESRTIIQVYVCKIIMSGMINYSSLKTPTLNKNNKKKMHSRETIFRKKNVSCRSVRALFIFTSS